MACVWCMGCHGEPVFSPISWPPFNLIADYQKHARKACSDALRGRSRALNIADGRGWAIWGCSCEPAVGMGLWKNDVSEKVITNPSGSFPGTPVSMF